MMHLEGEGVMNKSRILIAAMLTLMVSTVIFAAAQTPAKKEFVFRGKVEKIDEQTKTLTVNGENVEGWMAAMTMSYSVDKEAVLKTLKVGDTITAKVYTGDFKVLHDVQVVPAKDNKSTPTK